MSGPPSDPDTHRRTTEAQTLLKRVLKNTSLLLGGNVLRGLAGLVSMGILVQSLGAAEFGVFVLIQTFSAFVGDICTLQTWQVMTRDGAEALSQGDRSKLSKILRFGFRLDLVTYLIGTVIAASLVYWFGAWQGWPAERMGIASLFSLTILLRFSSMPSSVLNLFNRYSLFSMHAIAIGIIRLVAIAVVAWVNPTFEAFAITEIVVMAFVQIFLLAIAWVVLRQEKIAISLDWLLFYKPSEMERHVRNQFLHSSFQSSLSGTLKIASTHLVILTIGGIMNTIAVAHFKVIYSIGQIFVRLASPLVNATYPEFVRASQAGDMDLTKSLVRSLDRAVFGIAAVSAIGFLSLGSTWISVCFGAEFISTYWQMFAFLMISYLGLSNATLVPRLWAIECHAEVIWLQLFASGIHFGVILLLIYPFDLSGVVGSFLAYHAAYRMLGVYYERRKLRSIQASKINPEFSSDHAPVVPLHPRKYTDAA